MSVDAAEEQAWVERIAPNGSRWRTRADPARAAGRCSLIPGLSRRCQRRGSAASLFFADIAELSASEGEKLAHLDRHNIVFVGIDEETGQMLGLVRLKEELDEETAEFAIMVRSRLKGHGLGWMLMQRAIDYGKEKGLWRIYGDVLAENASMLQMCEELGFRAHDMGSVMKRMVLDLRSQGS